jgi:hypothetical protein
MIDYWKIGIAALLLLGAFATGWGLRNRDFNDYKQEVSNAAKAQEAHVESIKKQQTLVNKGIENEYEAKLSAIRNYYKSTSVWNNPNTSSVSSLSAAPNVADVIASYNQLISSCAETTQQVVSLQEWLNEQMGIK